MWRRWTFYELSMVKGRKGKTTDISKWRFFFSLLPHIPPVSAVTPFLFIGPPECTLVQRGGERESKTAHVKLPRRHSVGKWFLPSFFFYYLLFFFVKSWEPCWSLGTVSAARCHLKFAVNTRAGGRKSTMQYLTARGPCDPPHTFNFLITKRIQNAIHLQPTSR